MLPAWITLIVAIILILIIFFTSKHFKAKYKTSTHIKNIERLEVILYLIIIVTLFIIAIIK